MRAKRTDKNHAAVLEAIRFLGYPAMSLHAHGGGLEDIIVGVRKHLSGTPGTGMRFDYRWLLIEVKSSRNKRKEATGSQFTDAQRKWYEETKGFPRLVVMDAQDAVDQLRRLTS
jgi:hypothetical protein